MKIIHGSTPTMDTDADISIIFEDGDSEQLQRIVRKHLIGALKLFAEKNHGYATGALRFEGSVAGEYYQLERKLGKLWAGFIADDPDSFKDEPAQIVLYDMLGHVLLMMDALGRGNRK